MEVIQIKLKDIIPNPFKKEIDKGKLNEKQVQNLMEGYKMTTFHENILARQSPTNKDKYELVYGHHRLEAAKRVYGNHHTISLHVVEYTDDQMLVDLCRENLTQGEFGSFNSGLDSTLLVKKHLESQVSTPLTPQKNKRGQTRSDEKYQGVGARQIATFLSKQGKLISHEKIAQYLRAKENVAPDILEKAIRKQGQYEEGVGSKEIVQLSKIKDHDQQRKILKIAEDITGRKADTIQEIMQKPKDIQQKIIEGDLSLLSKPTRAEVKSEDANSSSVIGLRFMKRSLELINEMRFLRNTLHQFRKDKLFEHFTPKQRGSFSEKLTTIKKEYGELVDELEKSLEELK